MNYLCLLLLKSFNLFIFFFFFFQAEDGIRDLTVTGVQTCALPILAWRIRHAWASLQTGQYRACQRCAGGRDGMAAEQRVEFIRTGEQEIGRASCRERV